MEVIHCMCCDVKRCGANSLVMLCLVLLLLCVALTLSAPMSTCIFSAHCPPYISYVTSWEILSKNQGISSLVIISFILLP